MNGTRPEQRAGRARGAGLNIAMVVLLGVLALLAWLWRALGAYAPAASEPAHMSMAAEGAPPAADTLDLVTWNLGFASLGREMDFVADGGRHRRAASVARVQTNLDAIVKQLQAEHADVQLFQEVAEPGWATHGVDLKSRLRAEADSSAFAFAPMVRVTGIPVFGRMVVGQATSSRNGIASAVRHALPSESAFAGLTLQHYHVLETRLPARAGAPAWVLFNVHLAAFDDGELRRAQLAQVLRLALAAHAEGHLVIVGGDWNLRLAPTGFASSAAPEHRFWLRDLPDRATPAGWQWAVDPRTPTNRTLEAPYVPGVNYTSIIDGFLVSPGIDVLSVETSDLGFEHSDHHPVRLRVRAKPEPTAR